jgi:hypothetical protein
MTHRIIAGKRLLAKIVPEASSEEIDAVFAIYLDNLEQLLSIQTQDISPDAVADAEFLVEEVDNDELVDIAFAELLPEESERLRADFLDLLEDYRSGSLSPYGNIFWRSQ